MSRWEEIKFNLGLVILFPRLCIYVLMPFLFLLVFFPAPSGFPLLFLLSIMTNLGISRYLRLHQTESSPYLYDTHHQIVGRSSYFRIQIQDKDAFQKFKKDLRQEHRGEKIGILLRLDDLLMAPPIILLLLFMFIFLGIPSLVKYLWHLYKDRKLPPA